MQDRIRRNEERLRQLNLPALAQDLSPDTAPAKPAAERRVRKRQTAPTAPRRATRSSGIGEELAQYAGGLGADDKDRSVILVPRVSEASTSADRQDKGACVAAQASVGAAQAC
jgi:hypothetical protein